MTIRKLIERLISNEILHHEVSIEIIKRKEGCIGKVIGRKVIPLRIVRADFSTGDGTVHLCIEQDDIESINFTKEN